MQLDKLFNAYNIIINKLYHALLPLRSAIYELLRSNNRYRRLKTKNLLLTVVGIMCILAAVFTKQEVDPHTAADQQLAIAENDDSSSTTENDSTDSDYAATHAADESILAANTTDLEIGATNTTNNTLSLDAPSEQTGTLSIPDVSEDYPEGTSSTTSCDKHWKTVRVETGDTMAKIFARLALPKTTLHNIIDSDANGKYLANLHPGQELKFQFDKNKQLLALKLNVSPSKTITINYNSSGYSYNCDEQEIVTKLAYKESTIKDSLFAAAQAVALNDKTILQFADIFSWDIDFAMDIRENDSFRILFEERYVGNKRIGTGNILMAEFTNQNQVHRAIRFTDKNGRTGYYTPEGYGMQKAFLRNPVKFTRISSYFSHNRRHPILHRIRAHKGVDYAAPSGTPVEAAGDGKIVFIGTKNGYGQAVELQHGNKYSTFYAHLSRFAKGVKNGSSVRQGDIIGYVGRTGLATGDHLHYEFRVDGIHRDPLTVKLPKSLPIDKRYRRDFQVHASNMVGLLNKHNREFLAKR